MLHTGLITFHFAHHYGAQLQAYATMEALRGLGFGCEIIDYRLPHTTRTNGLFKKTGSVRDMASDAHTALHYAAFKRRFDRFEAFVDQNMALSKRRYTSFEELRSDPPACDVYVAGSDQIWNPYIFQDGEFDPSFLLAFVGEGRRIAYAPSLGVPRLPQDKADQLRAYLAPFSALSVRERRGRELIAQATGREARVVLDPTLLLTGADWGELALPPVRKGPYILCYFVSDPGEAAPYALSLSQRTGYPIVQLAGARRKIPGASELVFDAGPREFLGLFQHAAAVVTNSFHGAVFSLQFGKPFFTSMSPREREQPTFSRIYSLLSRLGCADRIIGLDTTAPADAPVDYAAVNRRLEAARADALAYLRAAVEGEVLPPEETVEDGAARDGKKPRLCAAADCTGCTACAAVCPADAISMVPDREGFFRPVVGDACIGCRKCETVCPGLHPVDAPLEEKPVFAARNRDGDTLRRSTSGGVFTALAEGVLAAGGEVWGAAFDENLRVVHRPARTVEELAPLRQTKYVQSDLTGVFRQVAAALDEGRQVLFSGTPCQVAGLKAYLGGDRDNLLTCDLVCHGVPSPGVFGDWLAGREAAHGSRAQGLLFRDKSEGWNKARLTLTFADGTRESAPLAQTAFGRGFGAALFLRPSCHRCPCAGHPRPGDFTLGDFWGVDPAVLPGGTGRGVSLVLLNSEKAWALWAELQDKLEAVPRLWAEAVAGNPRLLSPVPENPRRAAFFADRTARSYAAAEADFLGRPSLPYRAAAKVLTPKMKEKIRRILK